MKQAEQKRDLDRGPASQPAGFGQTARGPSKGKERLTRGGWCTLEVGWVTG